MNFIRLISRKSAIIAALGDVAVFLTFASIGSAEHGVILKDSLLGTGLPFIIVWLTFASLFGMYNRSFLHDSKKSIKRTTIIWPLCVIVVLGIRSVFAEQNINLSFTLVVFLIQGTMLYIWRYILVKILGLAGR